MKKHYMRPKAESNGYWMCLQKSDGRWRFRGNACEQSDDFKSLQNRKLWDE